MSENIIHFNSLSQLFKAMGMEPPLHPLIGILEFGKFDAPEAMFHQKMSADFYVISLKDGDCGMLYGRNYYDFEEGVLTFMGPNQVMTYEEKEVSKSGWMLLFHPDLIRQSALGQNIKNYNFFSYDVYEALHLSQKEEDILKDIIAKIQFELDQNIDKHSNQLLVSNIELMLNYCNRFYERQFETRSHKHSDVVTRVEQLIEAYYDQNKQLEFGSPSIQYFAEKVNLSANYLSDLLKKETGRNTKEHINDHVVDLAKTRLLNSEASVSEIAYDLGFNYPHYFSRMFKKSTGQTPQKYRELNFN